MLLFQDFSFHAPLERLLIPLERGNVEEILLYPSYKQVHTNNNETITETKRLFKPIY